MFNEICIYEAKLNKLDEIEELMKEVAEFYLKQDGVIDVHYIKRTHRQKDFNAVKEGGITYSSDKKYRESYICIILGNGK